MLYTERQVELDHCQWQNPIKQVLAVRNSRNQFSSYETAIKQARFEGTHLEVYMNSFFLFVSLVNPRS
jgi:hypothetical protein